LLILILNLSICGCTPKNISQDKVSEYIDDYGNFWLRDSSGLEELLDAKNIESLVISYREPIDLNFLSEFTQLKRLSIFNTHKSTISESLKFLHNLERLEIAYSYNIDISLIDNLKSLKYLSLKYLPEVDDITAISKLENLEVLSIIDYDESLHNWDGIKSFNPIFELTNLKRLTLTVKNVRDITNIRNLQNLEYLEIRINNDDISPLLKLSSLESLRIKYVRSVDYSPLAKINSLKEIWFEWSSSDDLIDFAINKMNVFDENGIYTSLDDDDYYISEKNEKNKSGPSIPIPLAANIDQSYYPQRNIERITASSVLGNGYVVENMIDKTWRSWSEGVEGNGIGESFTVEFKIPVKLDGFILKNGYGQLDYYFKNNRVKSFEIFFNDELTGKIVNIKDSYELERYYFTERNWAGDYVECTTITFKIHEIYPGTHYNDTCIAEIYFTSSSYMSNSPDIWNSYMQDNYSAGLLRAICEMDNEIFRVNPNNNKIRVYGEAWDGGYFWWGTNNSLARNSLNSPTLSRIFLFESTNPILLRINGRYNIYDLEGIYYYEDNKWRQRNEQAVIPLLSKKEEIEARGLSCHFEFPYSNIFNVTINAVRVTGEPHVHMSKATVPFDIIETYEFFWNGIIFEEIKGD
jgi:hypothetical protein